MPDGIRLRGGEQGDDQADNSSYQVEQGVGRTCPEGKQILPGGERVDGAGGEGTDKVKEIKDVSVWQVGPCFLALRLVCEACTFVSHLPTPGPEERPSKELLSFAFIRPLFLGSCLLWGLLWTGILLRYRSQVQIILISG